MGVTEVVKITTSAATETEMNMVTFPHAVILTL